MSSILPLLNKLVPVGLAIKGLEKVDPRYKTFFSGAFSAGYGADQAMEYLQNKITGNNDEQQRLERGKAQGTLRPDEAAGLAQVKQSENIKNLIQTGAGLGAGALGGAAALAANGASGAVNPSEITRMPPGQGVPKQIGMGQQQRQIGLTPQPGVPPQGSSIVPPISPMQQGQAQKISAMQRFQEHQQKKSMLQQEAERFQQGYGQAVQQLNAEEQQLMQEIQADRQGPVGQPLPKEQQAGSGNAKLLAQIQALRKARGG